MEVSKELFGIIAISCHIIAFTPYIMSTLSGKTKPHVFSWIIWSLTTFIIFLAQLTSGGGAGSWSTGASAVITILLAICVYVKKSDDYITRSDWVFFIIAISAIPIWYMTKNPLWAVIILTTIDAIGILPTIRKAYMKPFEEKIWLYAITPFSSSFALLALETYSITTILFPISLTIICVVLVVIILVRRKKVGGHIKL